MTGSQSNRFMGLMHARLPEAHLLHTFDNFLEALPDPQYGQNWQIQIYQAIDSDFCNFFNSPHRTLAEQWTYIHFMQKYGLAGTSVLASLGDCRLARETYVNGFIGYLQVAKNGEAATKMKTYHHNKKFADFDKTWLKSLQHILPVSKRKGLVCIDEEVLERLAFANGMIVVRTDSKYLTTYRLYKILVPSKRYLQDIAAIHGNDEDDPLKRYRPHQDNQDKYLDEKVAMIEPTTQNIPTSIKVTFSKYRSIANEFAKKLKSAWASDRFICTQLDSFINIALYDELGEAGLAPYLVDNIEEYSDE